MTRISLNAEYILMELLRKKIIVSEGEEGDPLIRPPDKNDR